MAAVEAGTRDERGDERILGVLVGAFRDAVVHVAAAAHNGFRALAEAVEALAGFGGKAGSDAVRAGGAGDRDAGDAVGHGRDGRLERRGVGGHDDVQRVAVASDGGRLRVDAAAGAAQTSIASSASQRVTGRTVSEAPLRQATAGV